MNSIYCKEYGEGSPLVLIHGFCETHEIWEELIPLLSSDFKIIAIDMPGFGKSPILENPFTIQDVAHAVIKMLAELNISSLNKCVMIGHSLGGYVALAVAEECPDILAGFCLFHSTALADSDEKKLNRNKVIEFVNVNGIAPFIETFVPSLFYQKSKYSDHVFRIAIKTDQHTVIKYLEAMRDRPDKMFLLTGFSKPILFLGGEKDTFIPIDSLAAQAEKSAFGTLKTLSGTGHMGMFEQSAQAAETLKYFANTCFWNGKC